jgi:hypothetical protein
MIDALLKPASAARINCASPKECLKPPHLNKCTRRKLRSNTIVTFVSYRHPLTSPLRRRCRRALFAAQQIVGREGRIGYVPDSEGRASFMAETTAA